MSRSQSPRIVAQRVRPSGPWVVGGALLLGLASAWFSGLVGHAAVPSLIFWALLGIPVSLALLAIGIALLLERQLLLRIDRKGLFDRRFHRGTIPWGAIAAVRGFGMEDQQALCVELKEPRRFPARLDAGASIELAALYGFGHFAITAQGLKGDFAQLEAAIDHYLHERKRSERVKPKPVEEPPSEPGFGRRSAALRPSAV